MNEPPDKLTTDNPHALTTAARDLAQVVAAAVKDGALGVIACRNCPPQDDEELGSADYQQGYEDCLVTWMQEKAPALIKAHDRLAEILNMPKSEPSQ